MHTDIYNIYVYKFFFASQRFNHSEIHLTTLAFISLTLHYTQCLLSTCLSVCVWKFCVLIYRKSLVIHSNCHFPAFSPFNFRACPAFSPLMSCITAPLLQAPPYGNPNFDIINVQVIVFVIVTSAARNSFDFSKSPLLPVRLSALVFFFVVIYFLLGWISCDFFHDYRVFCLHCMYVCVCFGPLLFERLHSRCFLV